jgi:contractile injection system tube protein
MERVAFLIEPEGIRLGALLNPESLVMRRVAGVRPRRSLGVPLTGSKLADDPLLFTGGGTTELTLELLFDVTLAGSSVTSEDVRDLTRPLWELAENAHADEGYGRPSLLRVVWGKVLNMACVVASVAERLEHFTDTGAPRRSWLSLRLLRVEEDVAQQVEAARVPSEGIDAEQVAASLPPESFDTQSVLSGGPEPGSGQRLDEIAWERYRDPSMWRLIASLNGIDDPMHLDTGTVLRLPPASALRGTS